MKALRRDLVRAAYYLLQIRERRVYRALGYRKIADYATDAAGLNSRQCRDFLLLARRLPEYPEVEKALGDGGLTWSQARVICTQAPVEDQEDWVDAARGMPLKELKEKLQPKASAEGPGLNNSPSLRPPEHQTPERNPEPPKPRPSPPMPASEPARPPVESVHHVTIKFTGEEYVLWERLTEAARRRRGLGEAILAGLAGDSSWCSLDTLVVIMRCPDCGTAVHPTSRGEIEVPGPALRAGLCDAVVEDAAGNRRRAVPPRLKRQAMQRARYRCEAAGCGHASFLQVHHRRPVAGAGRNALDNLMVLCSRCHRRLHEADEEARSALRNAPG